ncbi:MAG TPA: tRNA 2-thiouridine(34) synthase MnmA [Acidimicrobiales bacterium]|nr:tRNA 2-thiouridine(34) synthase MnmA [Acidimicrobiales bacterium]
MRVLVAMSGGVDSSVAAARLVGEGHQVVGATLKLWGGSSDSGCCSVGDVDDARRVAQQIGIPHYVFDMTEAFHASVVDPYVAAHAAARTPNPCVECNRHIKFERLLERADRLGFDMLATGHHARIVRGVAGEPHQLRRGADPGKDQSYVLSMLGQGHLSRVVLPIGDLTKREVRARAAELGLRTADKPDSQDVCFIRSDEGRQRFLGQRLSFRPATVVDTATGDEVGTVEALELVTVGQRRGFAHGADGTRRYVCAVDAGSRTVFVGRAEDVATRTVPLAPGSLTWTTAELAAQSPAIAQTSAHGRPTFCKFGRDEGGAWVRFDVAIRPVAPGQTVALYAAADPDRVLGAGIAA